jgi:hypothetical protein
MKSVTATNGPSAPASFCVTYGTRFLPELGLEEVLFLGGETVAAQCWSRMSRTRHRRNTPVLGEKLLALRAHGTATPEASSRAFGPCTALRMFGRCP